MAIKKFKVGQPLGVKFIDIHTNNSGWLSNKATLEDAPAFVYAYGEYQGTNKHKELVLSSLVHREDGYEEKHGARIYIPLGCIVSARQLK